MKLSTFSIKPLYNFLLEKDYHLFGCGGPVIATTRFFPRRYYLVYGKGIGAAYKKGDFATAKEELLAAKENLTSKEERSEICMYENLLDSKIQETNQEKGESK